MTTGLPGHNRGKVFKPGVGYVWPKRQPADQRKCKSCRKAGMARYAVVVVAVKPIRTEVYCGKCATALDTPAAK